jgi:hypothetical protein
MYYHAQFFWFIFKLVLVQARLVGVGMGDMPALMCHLLPSPQRTTLHWRMEWEAESLYLTPLDRVGSRNSHWGYCFPGSSSRPSSPSVAAHVIYSLASCVLAHSLLMWDFWLKFNFFFISGWVAPLSKWSSCPSLSWIWYWQDGSGPAICLLSLWETLSLLSKMVEMQLETSLGMTEHFVGDGHHSGKHCNSTLRPGVGRESSQSISQLHE